MKKKIIRIVSRAVLGGPFTNILNLSKNLEDEYDTLLIIGKENKGETCKVSEIKNKKIKFIKIDYLRSDKNFMNIFFDLFALFKIINILRNYKPDIVHTHLFKAGLLGRIAAYICRVPFIYHTYHGTIFEGYFSKIISKLIILVEKFLAILTTKIIVLSPSLKKDITNKFKIANKEKVFIISLGLDINRFNSNIKNFNYLIRKENNLKSDALIIGYVGRFTKIKNLNLILDSFAFAKKSSKKKILALFIGGGEEKQNLINKCLELKLNYTTDFISNIGDVYIIDDTSYVENMYSIIDILCISSINEGTPLTLLEGGNCCIPLLSTNVGGVNDIIFNNQNGIISDFINFKYDLLKIINNYEFYKYNAKKLNTFYSEFSIESLLKKTNILYKSTYHDE